MEKLSRFVLNQVQTLQESLESLLEKELERELPSPSEEPAGEFVPLTDLRHLKSTLSILPKERRERVIAIFARLSPYFQSGLALFLGGNPSGVETWVPGAAFYAGVYFPLPPELLNRSIHLPVLHTGEIRKVAPYLLLQPLQLTQLCDDADSCAFVMKVDQDMCFFLFSKLAEPWLRGHIENIYAQVGLAMADEL